MLINKHTHQWLEQECDSCTVQHENTSTPGDINVNDDNSDSEKCNEEKEDSEIGRSNYYLIKAKTLNGRQNNKLETSEQGRKYN
jgi:hypothetical protein